MEIKKENITLYLETLSRFEKVLFLLEHANSKIKYDDEETTSFDLEVCQTLLIQLINSPLFTGPDIGSHFPEREWNGKNLSFLIEKLKILLESLKKDISDYLLKNLSA